MDLLQAVMTQPLETIMEIYEFTGNKMISKMWLDYEALSKALEFGRLDVADFFLSNNCRVNKSDEETFCANTPLHYAVILKDINTVKKILKLKGSVDAKNADGDTPLHLAFINQDVDIVDAIFDHMKSFKNEIISNPKNKYGLSHMHIACVRNEEILVKLYLNKGEDVNHAISITSHVHAGYTSLHFAVKIGEDCIDTIRILLSRGADPFLCDASNVSAYDLNEERMIDYSLMQYILTKKKQEKCLPIFQIACMEGNLDYIETFLEMGTNVNEPLCNKFVLNPTYTPLHFAVENGKPMIIQKLLEYGADVNLCDSNDMTPLHLALYKEKANSSRRNRNIVEMLFTNLTDQCMKMTDSNGLSYFHIAVTRNKLDLVRKYLECRYNAVNDKVRRNNRNFSNFTPLHFGVLYKCTDVVKLLLEKEAEINRNDNCIYGTPLHMAVEQGDLQMVNLLLDHGPTVDVKRLDDKRTPFHLLVLYVLKRPYLLISEKLYAEEDAAIESIIKRMVLLDGDVNAQDMDGNTPLHIACSKIRIGSNCVKALLRYGANLDIENNNKNTPFDMSFLDSYRFNAEDYMTLYNHVQKIKNLGLWVNDRNVACCNRLLNEKDKCDSNAECFTKVHMKRVRESQFAEIERLKATKLHHRTSLYNIIWDDINSLKSRARTHQHLKYIVNVMKPMLDAREDFDLRFPFYGYLARLWYNLAMKHAEHVPRKRKILQVKARRQTSRNTSQNTAKLIRKNLRKRQCI